MLAAHARGDPLCSCADMEARVQAQVEAGLAGVKQELATLAQRLAHVAGAQPTQATNTSVPVDATGSTVSRRNLAHGGAVHHVAVQAIQVHEFPDGGSCQAGSNTLLLPKSRDTGTLSYTASVSDASADVSLITVTDVSTSPWTTAPVQTMPAPLKIVHDVSCSAAPTLELPLHTIVQTLTVSGTLTVGSTDVGAALSGGSSSWRDLAYSVRTPALMAHTSGHNFKYTVSNGVVYLAGSVRADDGSAIPYVTLATLPSGARPAYQSIFMQGKSPESGVTNAGTIQQVAARVHIGALGEITIQTPPEASNVNLDGITFRLAGA
ncbi:hypothetical protein OAO87_02520 [bacterium]|nr:hypothetical protein [bacterium]